MFSASVPCSGGICNALAPCDKGPVSEAFVEAGDVSAFAVAGLIFGRIAMGLGLDGGRTRTGVSGNTSGVVAEIMMFGGATTTFGGATTTFGGATIAGAWPE